MRDDDDTPEDALSVLAADHEDVRRLFAEYDDLAAEDAEPDDRMALATEICDALTAHATAEEEIFYPSVRSSVDAGALVDEAESEHAGMRALIEQILAMDPADDRYDATVRVLGEAVEHHVQEEEGELFARVRDSGLELQALGERIAARKEEVLAELGDDVD